MERYIRRKLDARDFAQLRPDGIVCDFCGGPTPVTIYAANEMSTGEKVDCWRWCACEPCDSALLRNDWEKLRNRVRRRLAIMAENEGLGPLTRSQLNEAINLSIADFNRTVQREQVPDPVPVGRKVSGFTAEYVNALEQRLRWLKWCVSGEAYEKIEPHARVGDETKIIGMYEDVLKAGDTFFMNQKFCNLVHLARLTIPDDTRFEMDWLQAKQGWMWIAQPFVVPTLDWRFISGLDMDEQTAKLMTEKIPSRISAIGWAVVEETNSVEIMCFQNLELWNADVNKVFPQYRGKEKKGFVTWSFFGLRDGDTLIDRIKKFEDTHGSESGAGWGDSGPYLQNRSANILHEIRWVYAAFHLMAQKLSTTVRVDADRPTRRRMEREPKPFQLPPFIKVITLRKLEIDRQRDEDAGKGGIDWQWQWEVVGHWRNQWYPSESIHKPVWIEAYIKGPDDKPLKPATHKIFVARR